MSELEIRKGHRGCYRFELGVDGMRLAGEVGTGARDGTLDRARATILALAAALASAAEAARDQAERAEPRRGTGALKDARRRSAAAPSAGRAPGARG